MKIISVNNFRNYKAPIAENSSKSVSFGSQIQYLPKDTVSFSGKSKDKINSFQIALQNARGLNEGINVGDVKVLDSIEGLQNGLKTIEHLDMHQIYELLSSIDEKRVSFPVVRGCHHNCSYCFLDAKAPIVRLKYEDFYNVFNDLAKISKRMDYPFENYFKEDCTLFYDSDGSEIYLLDKKNKVHEFPELNKISYSVLNKPGSFDTAGWNPNKKDIQARMERLVQYYSTNDEHLNEVAQICVSLNPFESIYNTSIMQRRAGNIKNAEYLKSKYIEMAVNTLHTFMPLLNKNEFGIICRAYPDETPGSEYDGFRVSDMRDLKDDILDAYREKYAQELEEDPEKYEDLVAEFFVSSASIGASARDNAFKNYPLESAYLRNMDELSDKEFTKMASIKNAVIVDTDGTVYEGNDYELCRTDIKLNLKNPVSKPIKPTPYEKVARYKKEES